MLDDYLASSLSVHSIVLVDVFNPPNLQPPQHHPLSPPTLRPCLEEPSLVTQKLTAEALPLSRNDSQRKVGLQ